MVLLYLSTFPVKTRYSLLMIILVGPQCQEVVSKQEDPEPQQKYFSHRLKQPLTPSSVANLALVPVSSALVWQMQVSSKNVACLMSLTSSILGDCNTCIVSADPVM